MVYLPGTAFTKNCVRSAGGCKGESEQERWRAPSRVPTVKEAARRSRARDEERRSEATSTAVGWGGVWPAVAVRSRIPGGLKGRDALGGAPATPSTAVSAANEERSERRRHERAEGFRHSLPRVVRSRKRVLSDLTHPATTDHVATRTDPTCGHSLARRQTESGGRSGDSSPAPAPPSSRVGSTTDSTVNPASRRGSNSP